MSNKKIFFNKRNRFYISLLVIIVYLCLSCSTFHHHKQSFLYRENFIVKKFSELCILCRVIFQFSSDSSFYNIFELPIHIIRLLILFFFTINTISIALQKKIRAPPHPMSPFIFNFPKQ